MRDILILLIPSLLGISGGSYLLYLNQNNTDDQRASFSAAAWILLALGAFDIIFAAYTYFR